MGEKYREINKANWDERAPAHAVSSDYAVERFVSDPEFVSAVVEFDRPMLGDISGLTGVHLQCHIGTDTVSLARLGARMTGLDFSGASLAEARKLVARTADPVDFVEADVYDAVTILGPASQDLVFTGIGALCWLPSIERWAETVAGLLRPGGRLFLREAHPVLWALDDARSDVLALRYPYFEQVEPLVWTDEETYVETEIRLQASTTHEWNHGLGEIVTALLRAGMEITALTEHDSVPWNALPDAMVCDERGEWRLAENPERLPASYTLCAVRGR
ncbi:class I SAM-dependent methyltransferase [Rhodococcus maanshanensis]|uniref:Methyltransferase domain-containing protein n=1 Tax=Rhodococcus maanshanensis TaxID=183556 RepID=A0A1H7SDG2_9NOCA|nr:class I SAM-dependent methyltransferase [Rhodococcus maanshanensis]SEL70660.1 Methyltransferase domain-containing protein [Rhodococcus maanshanensis]